jgi:phosphopantothenoylcysteine synthetase/decarboxylase
VKSINKHIVLGVTGSIAAYKSGDLIREYVQKGLKVSVVMTKEAEHFITPLTLSGLGAKVYTSMFDLSSQEDMPHIKLAQEASVVVIAPATANIIAKLSCGLADDLLTCVVLATKAPVLVAPAMNTNMLENIAVQVNFKRLKEFGIRFVQPVKGKLACGIYGDGHIAEITDIAEATYKLLK